MDYMLLAKELLSTRTKLNNLPAGEALIKMSEGEYYVLTLLFSNGLCSHPSQLSRSMAVSTARVAAILNKLEKKGFVQRSADPDDERKVIVTLTDKGCFEVSLSTKNVLIHLSKILESLGPEDAKEYIRIQKKLLASCTKMQS